MGISLISICIGSAWLLIYSLFTDIRKKQLVNIMDYQTTINRMHNLTNPFFDVAKIRAANSTFQGIQNLTYSPTNTRNTTALENTTPEETAEMIITEDMPVLAELQDKGLIGRSGNSLLLGFED